MLKALARSTTPAQSLHGVLPSVFGRMNKHHVPLVGIAVFYVLSAAVVVVGGAKDQELVLFSAVAVFASFLRGLTAMAFFAYRERHLGWFSPNIAAAIAVAFTLVANLFRLAAIGPLAATALVAGGLYTAWVRAGRPRGASQALAEAEAADEPTV